MQAKPSYIWVKDEGEYLPVKEWDRKVWCREAYSLDSNLVMRQEAIEGCRKALKSIGEYMVVHATSRY